MAWRPSDRWSTGGAGHLEASQWVSLLSATSYWRPIANKKDKKIVFVTNNATKSRKSYKQKFDQLGIDVHVVSVGARRRTSNHTVFGWQDEIYGSAYAAAVYLSSVVKVPKGKKVYVIGQSGLEEELRDEGLTYIGGTVLNIKIWIVAISKTDITYDILLTGPRG